MAENDARHVVLIVGGAVAGSEAAFQLAERGVLAVVIEQNDRPYGKVEDGLPRWHDKLRLQEERKIDDKLSHPGVIFLPRTRVGADLPLEEVLGWGLSAVVFANGAWRDRPLPLPGIDEYLGRGFWYQNAFVHAFNHYPEKSYAGPPFAPADDALVIGGGLASLDVVKILMLETVARALDARGHHIDLIELEHEGIRKALARLSLTLQDLDLKGCTLIYRRQVEDMPLAEVEAGAAPEQIEQARLTRRKLFGNFEQKYMFRIREWHTPVALIAEAGRIDGLRLARTERRNGSLVTLPENGIEARSPLVVSSIGSVLEPIPGVPMDGETYRIRDEMTGEIDGLDHVFAVGNAVTGRGNILASRRHGRLVSQHMLENYLMGTASGYEETLASAASGTAARVREVADRIARQAPVSRERRDAILARIRKLQDRVGYPGDYADWLNRIRGQAPQFPDSLS